MVALASCASALAPLPLQGATTRVGASVSADLGPPDAWAPLASLPRQPVAGKKEAKSSWRRQFTMTSIDDEILLGVISPQLALLFGSLNGEAGPIGAFAESCPGLDSSEQLAVDFLSGDVWLRDLAPAPLGVASVFGLLPRPLRFTGNVDVDLLRISWPSVLTLDSKPLRYDFENVRGNATEALPSALELKTARETQAAWRELSGPPKSLEKRYPRGDGATTRIRSLEVDADSKRYGPLKIEARDLEIKAVDAKGKAVKNLKKQLAVAFEEEADGKIILHKKIQCRSLRISRVDGPGLEPAITLETPLVATVASRKHVENGTDCEVSWRVNVSSAFSIDALGTFLPGRPAPSLPADPDLLLPKPPAAPANPPKLSFKLGVLPPSAKVRRLKPLGRAAARRGAYDDREEPTTLAGRAARRASSVVAAPLGFLARRGAGLLGRLRGNRAPGDD